MSETKASDLVERLRVMSKLELMSFVTCDEAADEIESLRAKLAEAEAERDTMSEGYAKASQAIGRQGTEAESLADQITALVTNLAAAEHELKRWKEVEANKPDFEKLWEETSNRADTAESRLKIAREALKAMLVDPPATLDEPDTDAEVIIKMREIAENALFLTEGDGK